MHLMLILAWHFLQSVPGVVLSMLWWSGTLPGASTGNGVGMAGNSTVTPLGQAGQAAGVSPVPGWQPAAINKSFYVLPPAINVPVQGPNVFVPGGCLVSIRAHNGTTDGNAGTVRVAQRPEIMGGINGDPLTPNDDISWPCDNLNQCWVIIAEAGDGIRMSIQAGRK